MPDLVLNFSVDGAEYVLRGSRAAGAETVLFIYDVLSITARPARPDRTKSDPFMGQKWASLTSGNTAQARELLDLTSLEPVRTCPRVNKHTHNMPCMSAAGLLRLLDAVELDLRQRGLFEGAKLKAARTASQTNFSDERRAATATADATRFADEAANDEKRRRTASAAATESTHDDYIRPTARSKRSKLIRKQRHDIVAELTAATAAGVLSSALALAAAAHAAHWRRVASAGRGDNTDTSYTSTSHTAPRVESIAESNPWTKWTNTDAHKHRVTAESTAPSAPRVQPVAESNPWTKWTGPHAQKHRAAAQEALLPVPTAPSIPAPYIAQAFPEKNPGTVNINKTFIQQLRNLLRRLRDGDTSMLTELTTDEAVESIKKQNEFAPRHSRPRIH